MKTNQRWYPNTSHRKFFRLMDGKLLYIPMQPDGRMNENETLQVDFDATQFERPFDRKYVTLSDELQAIRKDLEQKD
jgi:hypothetical protein